MLDRVRPMLLKLVRVRFTLGEGSLSREELEEIATDAVKDAVLTFDPTKAKWSTYAHYKADWAMLDALDKVTSRAKLSAVQELKAMYEYVQTVGERGNAMYDTDAQTEAHLQDALDELGGVFGAQLARSPEDEAARLEIAREVHGALDEMSPVAAGIVRIRHIEEHTLEETGQALGTSTSEVFRHQGGALRQLQAILRRRGFGEPDEEDDSPANPPPKKVLETTAPPRLPCP